MLGEKPAGSELPLTPASVDGPPTLPFLTWPPSPGVTLGLLLPLPPWRLPPNPWDPDGPPLGGTCCCLLLCWSPPLLGCASPPLGAVCVTLIALVEDELPPLMLLL